MIKVIGLIGENGSGKGTFVKLFSDMAQEKNLKVAHIKFSAPLVETLVAWNIPTTRRNLQKLPVAMESTFGKGCLTEAIKKRVLKTYDHADFIIIDGIRWKTDVTMLRGLRDNILIHITALPKIRYERMKLRKEKAGENCMSPDQFRKEEKAPTEIIIPQIAKTADYYFANNGSEKAFEAWTEAFLSIQLEKIVH